jgi:hypothetical protein
MSGHEINFELPKRIEHFLAALSKLYAQEGKRQLQELIVNSQTRIVEGWGSHSDFGRDFYGHALYLVVPEALFLRWVKQKREVQELIKADINKVHNIQDEFVEEVFLEMEVTDDPDWRKESGLFAVGKRVVPPDATKRIWGNKDFRLFLSHKHEVKKETADLKDRLQLYGVSGFVAHEDIHATQEWRDEIENALSSMDAFVALMTEGFHDSDWTDQEAGFALARGVPIISVKLDGGRDPYGFIGKFQALSSSWEKAAAEIVKVLVKHERMLNTYVKAVQNCSGWVDGNYLAEILPSIEKLSDEQADVLVAAFNENKEVNGSFGFNGSKPLRHGKGLVFHLNRLTKRNFKLSDLGTIEIVTTIF